MINKILIVAAHPDDEILGVGGTIIKHVKQGDEVTILILGDGETSRESGADIAKRAAQAEQAAKILGAKNVFLKALPDNKFDTVSLLSIIKEVEDVVFKLKPEIVYTHHAHDLNADHRLTFQAVMTACRPQTGFPVKKIVSFETLSSTEYQKKSSNQVFCPNRYEDITEFIEQKLEAIMVYQGELRNYPHPRSIEGIIILAQFRGMEVGLSYAEAFEIVREINN